MFDVGDAWLTGKRAFLTVFNVFFQNPKTWPFTFVELLHTFSRTLLCTSPVWRPAVALLKRKNAYFDVFKCGVDITVRMTIIIVRHCFLSLALRTIRTEIECRTIFNKVHLRCARMYTAPMVYTMCAPAVSWLAELWEGDATYPTCTVYLPHSWCWSRQA